MELDDDDVVTLNEWNEMNKIGLSAMYSTVFWCLLVVLLFFFFLPRSLVSPGGHSLIWPVRVCAAEQGMVFKVLCVLNRVSFWTASPSKSVKTCDEWPTQTWVAATRKVSPNWSQELMTCHSSHCFSIVWGFSSAELVQAAATWPRVTYGM